MQSACNERTYVDSGSCQGRGHFGDAPTPLRSLAGWLAERPELVRLNAHVRQKELVQA